MDYDKVGSQEKPETPGDESSKRILLDIAPSAWEHPADKAALQALRRIPIFDEVLKKMFGFFGEKPIRLAFQADAVSVSTNSFRKYTVSTRKPSALWTLRMNILSSCRRPPW